MSTCALELHGKRVCLHGKAHGLPVRAALAVRNRASENGVSLPTRGRMTMNGNVTCLVGAEHEILGRTRKETAIKPHQLGRHPDQCPHVAQVLHPQGCGLRAERITSRQRLLRQGLADVWDVTRETIRMVKMIGMIRVRKTKSVPISPI